MNLPVVLSIAGSDSSAGAGVQADLKAISALGCYGVTALTCAVAEAPGRVTSIQPLPPDFLTAQIDVLATAFPIAAAKTGMLLKAALAHRAADALERLSCPLVVDPVLVATSGASLAEAEALEVYRKRLFPRATLVTPNLDEVRALLGREIRSLEEMRAAGKELSEDYGAAFLIKGGHLRGDTAVDVLCTSEGMQEFTAAVVPGIFTHGTGCTYSAAIAAGLAKGLSLAGAVEAAKRYVTAAIQHFLRWQGQSGPVDALHHFAPQPTLSF